MKTYFATYKERKVTDVTPITREKFIELISSEKPFEIYHSQWSKVTPFIIISEYDGDNLKWRYSTDKDNDLTSIGELYDSIQYQGITNCYFNKK